MDVTSLKAVSSQELHQRIATTQGNIKDALSQLDAVTVQLGNPEPMRQAVDQLRELLAVLWLLHEAEMLLSNKQ